MKLKWLALLGIMGFPGYWVVWTYLFPQPYENLPLRVACFVLCAVILVSEYRPALLGRYHAIYSYVVLTLCLPFFFTFMMLCNQVNAVWLGSALCAVLYLTLMFDPLNLMISFLVGTGLSIGVFLATTGHTLPVEYWPALPVFMFALVGGIGLNHSAELVAQSKRLRYAMMVGSSVAHEMRTPLLSIRMDTQTCRNIMPTLVEAHRWAVANGWSGPALDSLDLEDIEGALLRIRNQTSFANTMVDMLLMNVRDPTPAMATDVRQSMADVLRQALAIYPFREHERPLIRWEDGNDFSFSGSDLLMRHVLFNLFKNALRAIAEAKHGSVEIHVQPGTDRNRLFVRDTGSGMSPAVLATLFEPFHPGGTDNTRVGIGLTFCRRVIDGLGGTITCRSEEGVFTEFEIALPALDRGASDAGVDPPALRQELRDGTSRYSGER